MKVIINQKRCKECGLCVAACLRGAINYSEEINDSGYRPVVIDDGRCTTCGICYTVCPDGVYEIKGA